MARIKIIPEAKKPFVPNNKNLNETRPRFNPPGGAPPLSIHESYNRQGTDGSQASKKNSG